MRKGFLLVFSILVLDTLLIAIGNARDLSLELLYFHVGFTFLILTGVMIPVNLLRKKLSMEECILTGTIGLLFQAIFSFPIGSFFGGTSPSLSNVILLISRNVILGLGFGAFSGWLIEKITK